MDEGVSSFVTTADAIYYLRVEELAQGGPYTSRAFRWDVGGTAPAVELGTLSTTPMSETATLSLDGGYLYAWTATSVRRVAIDGSGVDDLVLGPIETAAEGDGTVFFVASLANGEPIQAVSGAGGAPFTIATPSGEVTGLAVDAVSHQLVALTSYGIVRMNEDGTNAETFGGAEPFRWGPIAFDGSRVYFREVCYRIPDGDLSAMAWFDLDTLDQGWVGEEPGFPYVPYVTNIDYGGVWTTSAIYGYFVSPPPDHTVH